MQHSKIATAMIAAIAVFAVGTGRVGAEIVLNCGAPAVQNPNAPACDNVAQEFWECYAPSTAASDGKKAATKKLRDQTVGVYKCNECPPEQTGCFKQATNLSYSNVTVQLDSSHGSCPAGEEMYKVTATGCFHWSVSCTACN